MRWGRDGLTLDEIEKRLAESGEASWFYDPILNEHDAAMAWHTTTLEWDNLPAEHQGRMLETYRTQRTRQAWEAYTYRAK